MLDIQKFIWAPKVVTSEIDELTTRFELQYLPRGFWHTLWNAMRRIILWYNVAGSITGVKIKWAPHEYHVVDGIKESVIDMLLNIKKLRFKIDENIEDLTWVSQRISWVGIYDASALKLTAGIELLNPEAYLFEITDPSLELNFELRIERWYWYYSVDFLRNRDKNNPDEDVNVLLIDNDFKIVEYVKYEVEEIIEDFTWWTKDSLIIDIKSRHKEFTAKEIIMFAGEVLASYAKLFIFDDIYIDKSVLIEYEELETEKDKLQEEINIKTMPIDALPLSERTRNALIKNNILYVEDLEKKKKWELLLMKGVGRKAIEEINKSLANIWKSLIV